MTHDSFILLVEDQGLVRAGMRALIQISEPQATVVESATYADALARLTSQPFEIVFLDIDLKGPKSGIDVLKEIREAEIDTRVIMLSGRTEREVVLECIAAGASGFIPKDADADGIFRRALDTIFKGSIFLPSSILGRGAFSPSYGPRSSSTESLGLSSRAMEVLFYLCQGLPNKAIAKKMNVEEGTVRKDYVPQLFRKLNVARRTELIIEVARRGLVIPTPQTSDSLPDAL